MVHRWSIKVGEITMRNAKGLSHNWKKEEFLCNYKKSLGLKSYKRSYIFWSVRVLMLLAVVPFLLGCGNKDNTELINAINTRLDMIEERLLQLEKTTQTIPLLESQLTGLQESVIKLDRLVAAKPEVQPLTDKKSIPQTKARYHVVRRGDTLYQIAQEYGVSMQELIHLNNLTKTQTIYPGQKLMLAPGNRQ
jgi:LysM repeat protein